MILSPKNWHEFQHYNNRNPPWIKLHKSLLDDYEFQSLPVASRALAPMLWLLASESMEGQISGEPEKIAFRLRMGSKEFLEALKPLIVNCFVLDASNLLATCEQLAMPETETETEKKSPLPPKGERGVDRIAPYLELWNAKLVPLGYGKADRATKKRRDGLTARLKDNPDFLETFTKAVDYLSRDAWWLGKASQFTVDLLLCQVNRAQELSEKTPSGPKTNSPSHRSRVDAEYIEALKTAKPRKEVPDVELSEEDEKMWEMFR